MRLLFLVPSQYRSWEQEPFNHEVRLPILQCGAMTDHRTFDYKSRAGAVGRAAMLEELRELAASFAPDIIIYSNTLRDWRLNPDELASLRRGHAKILAMLFDTHNRPSDQEAEFFRALDGVIIGDSVFAYTRYRLLAEHHHRGKTVIFLPGHQVLPELFHPGDGAKVYDVSHVGTVYGGRRDFVERLARGLPERTLSLFGGLFERTEVRRIDNLVLYDYARTERFLTLDEYARIVRQSRCCLSLQTDPGYSRVRGKTFEMLASRALCVAEDIKEYRLLLPPEGYVAAASPEDAAVQIGALLDDPAELDRRASAGYEWFRDTFDSVAFWREGLAAALTGDSPGLRYPNAQAAFESLRADLFVHYAGPPSEESLMKLEFS